MNTIVHMKHAMIEAEFIREAKLTISGERMFKKEIETKVISLLLEIKRSSYPRTIERCEASLKELKPQYEKAFGRGSFKRIYAVVLGVG